MSAEDDLDAHALFLSIGKFIYYFSRLEFSLKARLAGALNLESQLFDTVICYDFGMLTRVLENTLKLENDEKTQKTISSFFNRCRALNDKRVIIAHGSWMLDGARHVSRQKLEAQFYFTKRKDIEEATEQAQKLWAQLHQLGSFKR